MYILQESEQGTRHEPVSNEHVSHSVTGKQTSDKDTVETLPSEADPGKSSEDVGVNLCGAVDIRDVRSLIKEWICSTPGIVFTVLHCVDSFVRLPCH